MKRLLLGIVFTILIVSSVGFVSAVVPMQNAAQASSCTTTTKVLYDTVSLRPDHNQFAFAKFDSARSGSVGFKELRFAYDNNTNPQIIQAILAHQVVTSTGKGRIYPTEATWAQINDWLIINQGGAGTILEVTDLIIESATSGKVSFQDVITGESQTITLTFNSATGYYEKSGVNFYGGTGYNLRMNPSGTIVSITWGPGSSPGNVGAVTTRAPDIRLANGSSLSITTVGDARLVYGINCTNTSIPPGLIKDQVAPDSFPAIVVSNASTLIDDDSSINQAQRICIPITNNSHYFPMNFIHSGVAFAIGNINCTYIENHANLSNTISIVTCQDIAGNKVVLDFSEAVQYGTVVNITLVRRVSDTDCTGVLNTTNATIQTYRLCSVNNTCVQVSGKGTSTCSVDNDCNNQTGPRHLDCVYKGTIGWCAYVAGAGDNTCLNSNNCNQYYSACVGFTCSALIGNKNSTCSSDSDCSHLGCVNNMCTKVLGAGANTCQNLGGVCIHESPPVECTGFVGWIKRLFGKC